MFQGDECSGGWVSRGMGVPVTDQIMLLVVSTGEY